MRKIVAILLLAVFCIPDSQPAYSWGFFAHKKINRMAVFTLPPEMITFYKKHIEYISEHAVDPDKRRYVYDDEVPRHYIDIDHYGTYPFNVVPEYWSFAVKKFTEDTLNAHGIVPWYIEKMMYRLQKAFVDEDIYLILHYSADLGHYVADAHVPLHTTENYDGQKTNQNGIHGLWESRIPELISPINDDYTGAAKYFDKPIDKAWNIVKTSHAEVDSVLKFEAALNASYSPGKKYSFERRNGTMTKVYSVEYAYDYDKLLNGMVEKRMRESIIAVGSLWYTAWVNAGKPDLDHFGDKDISDSLREAQHTEQKRFESKKESNRPKYMDCNDQ